MQRASLAAQVSRILNSHCAVCHCGAATNVGTLSWNSPASSGAGAAGFAVKFTLPTIAMIDRRSSAAQFLYRSIRNKKTTVVKWRIY